MKMIIAQYYNLLLEAEKKQWYANFRAKYPDMKVDQKLNYETLNKFRS